MRFYIGTNFFDVTYQFIVLNVTSFYIGSVVNFSKVKLLSPLLKLNNLYFKKSFLLFKFR